VILVTVALLIVVSVLVVRSIGGMHTADRVERIYIALSPLPWIASTVIPATIGLSGLVPEVTGRRAIWVGVGLSAMLTVVGTWLVARLLGRRKRWGWPLGASVVLAASPFLVTALSWGLLWVMGRVR
jgi:hypothetical protein